MVYNKGDLRVMVPCMLSLESPLFGTDLYSFNSDHDKMQLLTCHFMLSCQSVKFLVTSHCLLYLRIPGLPNVVNVLTLDYFVLCNLTAQTFCEVSWTMYISMHKPNY